VLPRRALLPRLAVATVLARLARPAIDAIAAVDTVLPGRTLLPRLAVAARNSLRSVFPIRAIAAVGAVLPRWALLPRLAVAARSPLRSVLPVHAIAAVGTVPPWRTLLPWLAVAAVAANNMADLDLSAVGEPKGQHACSAQPSASHADAGRTIGTALARLAAPRLALLQSIDAGQKRPRCVLDVTLDRFHDLASERLAIKHQRRPFQMATRAFPASWPMFSLAASAAAISASL
ncbi:hypothetical protein J2X36_005342, partial [Methylobacterium sp. BE186]|uniref:hypothetical protein n=1 Tax=Methylobacterium sp. BE186 TaxID=2817715 RepID=UPI002854762E